MFSLAVSLLCASLAYAAQAPVFVPPSRGPTFESDIYPGRSNSTLPFSSHVRGRAFNRFVQIWLENTDFATAKTTAAFRSLAKEGVTLTQYYGVTHPSQPNYLAAVGGSFFGLSDDAYHRIPSNVATIVDLLEEKNISWASYHEHMPTDGYQGDNYTSPNYVNSSAAPYTYYWRKHNPLMTYDSVASIPTRAARHRNFNDFARDVTSHALPQWIWITPNIDNDAHNTNIDFAGAWLQYFLFPLLKDPRFNNDDTLILLTFDETENYGINNNVFTLLLGNALPPRLRGTTDPTYYTHYSALSTVQNNWQLGSLGRGDTNKSMANVFDVVAKQTRYHNLHVTDIPLTNITGTIPGPLNSHPELVTPYPEPDRNAVGAGGGPVFIPANSD
ncbi:phosphoesterase family-domain-containing protein [Hysterangium stoloniferum]|nr:phosphoesterase family-domain-containing protein [Hysterangium stoloniferum]